MEHGLFRGAGIVNHDRHVRVSISQCGSLNRAGCGQPWVILEPINCGGDDGPTKLIIHVDRSIWVDIRKSKEWLQLFHGTATIEVDPVHLTVAFIRITATVSDRSQDKTCLLERAEPAFGGLSTSGHHAPSFYRLSDPHDTGTGGSVLESRPGQVLASAEGPSSRLPSRRPGATQQRPPLSPSWDRLQSAGASQHKARLR